MPQMCNIEDFDPDRDMIRQSLDAMANDIGMAMRDAGLADIPTYLVIPNSGSAIATLMTPLDPSDDDWARALEIACQVIQKKLGSTKLYTCEMAWTTANEPSGVAEATSNAVSRSPTSCGSPPMAS